MLDVLGLVKLWQRTAARLRNTLLLPPAVNANMSCCLQVSMLLRELTAVVPDAAVVMELKAELAYTGETWSCHLPLPRPRLMLNNHSSDL